MTSKEFKVRLEAAGWGIAHARRLRSGEVRAYLSCIGDSAPVEGVNELRWYPRHPARLEYWKYVTTANGYGQEDRFVLSVPLPLLPAEVAV